MARILGIPGLFASPEVFGRNSTIVFWNISGRIGNTRNIFGISESLEQFANTKVWAAGRILEIQVIPRNYLGQEVSIPGCGPRLVDLLDLIVDIYFNWPILRSRNPEDITNFDKHGELEDLRSNCNYKHLGFLGNAGGIRKVGIFQDWLVFGNILKYDKHLEIAQSWLYLN